MQQHSNSPTGNTYQDVGVDVDGAARGLNGLLGWLNKTHVFPGAVGRPLLPNGFFANVHDLGNGIGIAISTDGVGTKLMVAEMTGRYVAAGIDCVAVNVNDIICVGARPIALVDYVAVQRVDPAVMEQLGQGLYQGAQEAGVAIASGELAQIPEMLRGVHQGTGFDIAGTAIGVVPTDRIIDGRNIRDADVVIGFHSSGIHSNGLTLARATLLGPEAYTVDSRPSELGCTLGEEMQRPTRIYVRPVLEAIAATQDVVGLAHISGDGFLNLLRLRTSCGFELSDLPAVPPIFTLIQKQGGVTAEEMYLVFNMGVGFCVVVRPNAVDTVLGIAARLGFPAQVIGHAKASLAGRRVTLPKQGLIGEGKRFRKAAPGELR